MIEKTVLDYLTDTLEVPAYMEMPEKPPNRFLVIEKTGSSEKNMIFDAMIAVKSYGKSLADAAAVNERVKKAMRGLTSMPDVSRCSLNSDYNFTDTSTKRYRYQAVFDITHY